GKSEVRPQIRVTSPRLSITFLLEDRAINSSFFLDHREPNSKNFLEDLRALSKKILEHLTYGSNFFQARKMRRPHRSLAAFEQPLFQLFDATFQLLQLLAHRRHAADVSVEFFVFIEGLNRDAPPHTGADNLPRQNARLRSDDRAALHAN